jgi:hypothetical protein
MGVVVVAGGGYYFISSGDSGPEGFDISIEEDTAPGELTRLTVAESGEPVQDANISIDGEFIGTTNSQGIKGFETPDKENFTVEASKDGFSDQDTFTVTEEGSFDQSGSEDDSSSDDEDDSDSEDSGSDNQDDSDQDPGQDSNEDDDSGNENDSQDSDDTQEEVSEDFTGLQLDSDPAVGELRTLTVYEDGSESSGVEVSVNNESVGSTGAAGTVNFAVPDVEEITVTTDTGLEETFTVEGYTSDEDNQQEENDTEEDTTTGIQLDSDPVSGTSNRVILYDNGERVSGETVYLDGEELGQTGSNGAIEFDVPLQDSITISTDYDLEDQTFDVQEEHPEPEITLLDPSDSASFETFTGENTEITFEASADITESSGTASVMIDGEEAYKQDLSQGENSISTTQALSGGSHTWSLEVDTSEHNTSSSERSLTVTEVEPQEGLSLQNDPVAEEYNYVVLYENDEPVEGEEIFVNDASIGTTDSDGEAGFEVPDTPEITVSSTNYEETFSVSGYTEEINIDASFQDTIYQGRENTLEVTGDGSSLEDATVYVNEVEQGLTGSNGEVTFEVPEQDSIGVEVEKNGSQFSEAFSTNYVDFTIDYPESGGLVQDYGDDSSQIDFNVEGTLDTDISGSYQILVDGNQKLSNSVSSGTTQIDESVSTDSEGSHQLQLVFDDGDSTADSNTIDFEAEWVENPFEFNLTNPDDGESLQDYEATLKYFVYYDVDHESRVYVELNGEIIDYTDFEGDTLGSNTDTPVLSSGTHSWKLIAEDKRKDINHTSEERTFTTEEEPPVALLQLESPEDDETVEAGSDVQVDYYTEVYEDSEHSVVVNGDYSRAPSKELSQGDEGTYSFQLENLEAGDYTITISAVSDSSGEEVFSEKRQLQVE